MKENIPEKIYIGLKPSISGGYAYTTVNKDFPNAVEYICADAFIKKACEWLSKHAKKYYFNKEGHYLGTDELVEDFELSMELL